MMEQQLRILLLDDEEALRMPLEKYLEENFGYQVDTAATGEEALRLVGDVQGGYDVTLLDEVLYPGPDGIEVMQEIQARYPDIECIVFTAWGPESRQRALQAGAFRYLERPFDTEELALLIRSAAQQVRLRAISRAILSERDLDEVLKGINVAACSLALADEAAIVLVDETTGRLSVHAQTYSRKPRWWRHFKGQELSREIVRTGQVVRVPNTTLDKRVNLQVIESDIRSFVGVPVPGEQENLGVLYVYSRKPGWFDEWGTVAVVQTLAGQAGLAIANAQAFRQIHAHAGYMEALVRAGQEFTRTVQLEDQLALVWDFMEEQLKVATFFVALYDKEADVLRFPLAYDEGQWIQIPDRSLGDDRTEWGFTGYVVKAEQELHWPTQEIAREQCSVLGIEGIQIGEPCQSCFYLPLKLGDEVTGAISIQSYDRYAFTSEMLNACRALGSQLVVALQNNRLFEAETRRRDEAETLREAALALTTTLDQQQVFERILSELQKVVPYDSASVQLLKGNRLEIIGGHGFPNLPDILGIPFPVDGDNPNRVVMRQRAPFIVSDAQAEYPRFSQEPHIQADIHAWLGVPMLVGDRLIGMIALDKHQPEFYTEEHAQLAQAFVTQAALVIENTRLYREAQEGQAYLRSLYQASGIIISLRDPDQVLEDIVEEACDAVQGWRANVVLIDEEGRPQRLARAGFDKHFDADTSIRPTGISAKVVQNGKPVLIEDVRAQSERVNPGMIADGVGAAACFPLRLREKSIGVMWVHYRELHHFSEAEVEALRLYANQAAIAYDNARRMRELEHMRRAAEKLASVAGVQEVLQQIVRSAREVLEAASAVIWSFDAVRQTFLPDELVADSIDPEVLERFREDEPSPGGTAGMVIQERYLAVTDVDDPKYAYLGATARGLRGAIGVKAFQGIALRESGETLGVLYVNYDQCRSFTDENRASLETFAYHAALTLKKARLLEQVSKARDTARVVAEVSVLEDLRSTLNSIARGTQDALGCDAVTLYTYDQSRDEFGFPPAMVGVRDTGEVLKLGLVARESVVRRIVVLDKPYVAEDAPSDPVVGGAFVKREDIKSSVSIPLKVGDRKVGVMFVNYRSHHHFAGEELANIELFAYQAAVAIRNAQLYEETTRRAAALEALYEAGRAVASTLTLDEILNRIVEQAWRLAVPRGELTHFSHLAWVDGNKVRNIAAYPPEILPMLRAKVGEADLERDESIGITGRVVKTGKPELVGDTTRDCDYIEFDPSVHSQLSVPIRIGEQVIGVINVEHPDYYAFDKDDQRDLESLAAQAAITIQNARLYQQATERLNESQTLQQVATSLAGSLELQEVLNVVMMAAMRLTDTGSGSIMFWDSQAKTFTRSLITTGPDQTLQPYRSHARPEGGIARAIIDGRKPIVIPDTWKDHRVSPVAVDKGRRALIGVPLMSREEPIGVLYVNSSEPRQFSNRQVALLETLSSQAVIAIERARQYEELKRTKGLVGARTALAWMGIASSAWRHTVDKHAVTIREQVHLLRKDMGRGRSTRISERMAMIERLVTGILEKPITPPLSTEEGVESVPLNALIGERAKQIWQNDPYKATRLKFNLGLPETATVRVSPEWLRRAFDILVDNAVEAVAGREMQEITVGTRLAREGAEIFVSDTGPGIPEEIQAKIGLEHIEKPEDAKGLGMGLLMAQTIVHTYGGEIKVESTGPTGTTIVIWLPLE
jgi:GAF domain-containing protein/CheY-like chemotaxis protein